MPVDESVVKEFYKKRFKRKPKGMYYEEWVQRFESGSPHMHMDSESMKVWLSLMKKHNPVAYENAMKKLHEEEMKKSRKKVEDVM